jgi:hypothetical protein
MVCRRGVTCREAKARQYAEHVNVGTSYTVSIAERCGVDSRRATSGDTMAASAALLN